jgi:ketosteroid isomerase-like protein
MPDVGTQLRTYFDEVVERMTEEDIRIRASTERGVPVRVPRFQIRPVAALATGFGIAMTLLGGVMVAAKFLGGEPSDVAGNGVPGASTASDPGSPWLLLLLMAGFGLLAFGMWSMRRSAGDVRERGDENMQTIERPEAAHTPPGETTRLRKRNRLLMWLVGILAVAVIGFGAWLIADAASGDGSALPTAVEDALDDYVAAWNARDGAAAVSLTTEDFVFVSQGQTLPRDRLEGFVNQVIPGARIEVLDWTATGDGPYYTASTEILYTGGNEYEGSSLFTVVEEDGAWKIRYQYYAGPF